MAQFDVHRLGDGLVIDCQADLLKQLDSRFVVPLARSADVPTVAQRLNPIFDIDGESHVMLTQAAAAVQRRELGSIVASLAEHSLEITSAIDVLVSGV